VETFKLRQKKKEFKAKADQQPRKKPADGRAARSKKSGV
jgi:hypothetical protein